MNLSPLQLALMAAGPAADRAKQLELYGWLVGQWHIHCIDPATGFQARMTGRADAAGIVQEGTLENGTRLRWSFSDLQTNSFRWMGEVSLDNGKRWMLQVDIAARRVQ